jgi:predicted lipoprotein with Yx(FWY)xxD motif
MLRMIPLALVAALTLAACASSSTTTPPAAGGTTTPPATSGSTVQVANSAQYGSILVDAQGNTLYLFDQDTGKTSACTGACIAAWPALTVTGSPTAGAGVTASLLGTAKQADGSNQVTYNGHLLYLFSGDGAAGDTTGEGVNGFFVISSTGDKVAAAMAPSSSSSSAYHY